MLYIYLSTLDTDEEKRKFEKLYIIYKDDMYDIAHNILKNKFDAEDAVHNAFMRIANSFKSVMNIQSLKPYIAIVTKNTAIDIYNKNKKISQNTDSLFESNASISVDFFERFEFEDLVSTIESLTPVYKDILYLHYFNGIPVKLCAKSLNITEGNAYKRIERAKMMLSELLEKENVLSGKQ